MAIKKRNLLCVKKENKLKLGQLLIYKPYKNILQKFVQLATDIGAKDFDPVAKVYYGLLSAPKKIRDYYEALLGVTSYYQSSHGGRGRYIEKKIASAFENCSLDIKLSELPIWLKLPKLHKRKGIFTLNGLSTKERSSMRTIEWDWTGSRDENTDLGSMLKKEKSIILLEAKNRIDTGGSSARREIWTSQKFGIILDYLLSGEKIYKKNGKKFSLIELIKFFGFKNLEMYIGILFDKGDRPATIKIDKQKGFYSTSKEGFKYLLNKIRSSEEVDILNEDLDSLEIELYFKKQDFKLKIGSLYGNDITARLFRKKFPVSNLLLLKYDDMWLSSLTAIDERTFLIKYGKNFMSAFKEILKRDKKLRMAYDDLIESECKIQKLKKVVVYLLKNYKKNFENRFIPSNATKDQYLADIIQILCAADS